MTVLGVKLPITNLATTLNVTPAKAGVQMRSCCVEAWAAMRFRYFRFCGLMGLGGLVLPGCNSLSRS
jgi:hypothetical protein